MSQPQTEIPTTPPTRRRTRGANRQKLVTAGLELFHRQGFQATGVQELADLAGVPKGSFYNYFDSKDEFGLAILEEYALAVLDRLDAELGASDASPLAQLKRFLCVSCDDMAAAEDRSGCLAGNFAQEMASQSPEFRQALDGAFARFESRFAICLQRAQEAGEVKPELETDALAHYLYNSWQGAILRMKTSRDVRALEVFQEIFFQQISC